MKRTRCLIEFERKIIEDFLFTNFPLLTSNSKFYVAGIDEVGRGALAGPVVVGAVILASYEVFGIDDSKKLSPKKREDISSKIKENCIGWSIGITNEKVIDEKNILQATYLAAREAINNLQPKPNLILADKGCIGDCVLQVTDCRLNPLISQLSTITDFQSFTWEGIPVISIKNGDALCVSIASASIIAKVARDDIMKKEHMNYPEFNFLKNKGYGTKEHLLALRKYGPCPLHRLGFRPVREYINI